jgi:hypothetical protein
MPVQYCVNARGIPIGAGDRPILSPDGFASKVQGAFATWQQATNGGITFRDTGFCDNDPSNGADYTNTIGWADIGSGILGQAHTGTTEGANIRAGVSGEIFEADVVLDTFFAQSYDDVDDYLRTALPHILLHETGHFIGLGHSKDECATMSAYGLRYGLCQDDIDGARALYSRP